MNRSLVFIFLFAVLAAVGVQAQSSSSDKRLLWVVQRIQVEPTLEGQFEAVWRERAEAARKAGLDNSSRWYVHKGILTVGKYETALQIDSFNDLDQPEAGWRKPLEKAVGREMMAAWDARERATIRNVVTVVGVQVPELSYEPATPAPGPYRYIHFGVDYVKPAMLDQYRRVILKFREALTKIGHPHGFRVFETLYGESHAFAFVWPKASAEDHHRTHDLAQYVVKAFGQEEAVRMGREWRECLWDFESYGRQPLPELSFSAR